MITIWSTHCPLQPHQTQDSKKQARLNSIVQCNHRWTKLSKARLAPQPMTLVSAAGSASPPRFGRQARTRKVVSSLRFLTAVHNLEHD